MAITPENEKQLSNTMIELQKYLKLINPDWKSLNQLLFDKTKQMDIYLKNGIIHTVKVIEYHPTIGIIAKYINLANDEIWFIPFASIDQIKFSKIQEQPKPEEKKSL